MENLRLFWIFEQLLLAIKGNCNWYSDQRKIDTVAMGKLFLMLNDLQLIWEICSLYTIGNCRRNDSKSNYAGKSPVQINLNLLYMVMKNDQTHFKNLTLKNHFSISCMKGCTWTLSGAFSEHLVLVCVYVCVCMCLLVCVFDDRASTLLYVNLKQHFSEKCLPKGREISVQVSVN